MGRMFKEHFERIGRTVAISDREALGEKELVRNCELVVVSVPIAVTPEVIGRIKPWLRRSQLLSDFTSVKNRAIPCMLETDAAVISCHPLFGGMADMAGQNVILLPVRSGKFLAKYKRLYRELDLNITVMEDWRKHDESMSFVQGLMHFLHIVFTQTLKAKRVDLETIMSMCSPIYRAYFAFACRILQREPRLYTHILMDNPENIAVLKRFVEEAKISLKLIEKGKADQFVKNFEECRDYLGEIGKRFGEDSDFLVEELRKRNG